MKTGPPIYLGNSNKGLSNSRGWTVLCLAFSFQRYILSSGYGRWLDFRSDCYYLFESRQWRLGFSRYHLPLGRVVVLFRCYIFIFRSVNDHGCYLCWNSLQKRHVSVIHRQFSNAYTGMPSSNKSDLKVIYNMWRICEQRLKGKATSNEYSYSFVSIWFLVSSIIIRHARKNLTIIWRTHAK
jgi:hypothetical protein